VTLTSGKTSHFPKKRGISTEKLGSGRFLKKSPVERGRGSWFSEHQGHESEAKGYDIKSIGL
jgi:hypothetical protein